MKLAIFGATGRTGRLLVERALDAGSEVVVYARNPAKLDLKNEHLSVIQGELDDEEKVEEAVRGADAVISMLGPRGGSKGRPLTRGMGSIITAMKKTGVRRLVATSTLSAKDPGDLPELRARLLVGLVSLTMHDAYKEIIGVAEEIRGSDLDWTVVRLAMLNDKPRTGKIRAGYVGTGEVGTWISRADVADFLLGQVGNPKYLRKAPAISN